MQYASVVKEVEKDLFFCRSSSGSFHLLITGIGSPASIYQLTSHLKHHPCSLLVHFGIAGSFKQDIPLGTVVEVVSDRFADLGIESGQGVESPAEAGLIKKDTKPYRGEEMLNTSSIPAGIHRPAIKARGITLNTVTGTNETAHRLVSQFSADVETMESAACFYVCLMEHIPFYALRGISNYVGKRDKAYWNVPLAVDQVNAHIIEILKALNV
jgi:futalosine hydrolase